MVRKDEIVEGKVERKIVKVGFLGNIRIFGWEEEVFVKEIRI